MAVDLKEYLKSVYELESVLEASMMLEREYSNTLVTLGRPMKLVEPCEPEKRKVDTSGTKEDLKEGLTMLLLTVLGAAVLAAVGFGVAEADARNGFIGDLYDSFWGGLLGSILILVFIGACLLDLFFLGTSLIRTLFLDIPARLCSSSEK